MHLKQAYKNIMPHSLFGRSLLIIVLPLLLTMSLATFVFFDRHWSTTTERLINSLAGEIAMISDQISIAETENDVENIKTKAWQNFNFDVEFYPLKKLGGNKLDSRFYVLEEPISQALKQKKLSRFQFYIYTENGRDLIDIKIEIDQGIVHFTIPEKRIFSSTTYIFLIAMLGGGFFLMAIAIIFMRNQVRPVRRLAMAAEKLGKGEDVIRFKAEGAREVRQAANAFLVMRERIKRQIRQRTDMLAGVSHDLRTPLTRLKLQLAMLEQNSDIEEMKNDITSMEQMINGYLAFARGDEDEETTLIDLENLLNECVDDGKRHNQDITFDSNHAGHVLRGRKNSMKRLFNNLISNADKYAQNCWISVNPLPNALEIWIEDDGQGISEEQYEAVFKPFYRLDLARNVDDGGVGLGLSIARDIAMNHGGDIRLEKSLYGGLKAVVRLPL